MMKRALPALRPLIAVAVLGLPLALGIVWAIEDVYGVPLTARSFRFERPLAATLLVAGVLVLVARGYAYKRRIPRLTVSRGTDLKRIGGGFRIWLEPRA